MKSPEEAALSKTYGRVPPIPKIDEMDETQRKLWNQGKLGQAYEDEFGNPVLAWDDDGFGITDPRLAQRIISRRGKEQIAEQKKWKIKNGARESGLSEQHYQAAMNSASRHKRRVLVGVAIFISTVGYGISFPERIDSSYYIGIPFISFVLVITYVWPRLERGIWETELEYWREIEAKIESSD